MAHALYNTTSVEIHAMGKLTVTTVFKGDLKLQLIDNDIIWNCNTIKIIIFAHYCSH